MESLWKKLNSLNGQIQNEINSINIQMNRNQGNWNLRLANLSNKLRDEVDINETLVKLKMKQFNEMKITANEPLDALNQLKITLSIN